MSRVIQSAEEFIIVGENIHATRVVLRNGRRAIVLDDGREVVPFKSESDEQRHLTVPEWFKGTQPYEQGQIKHFMIAMRNGISDDPQEREEAEAYIQYEVRRQVAAGAHYLDINVDEVHYDLTTQKHCMRWTIEAVQEMSPIPLSIDSSNSEIIGEGLAAYSNKAGRPMINSLALERLETLDMVKEYDAKVIVMATSGAGMPENADDRVENVNTIMEHLRSNNIPLGDIFLDAIVFPISVDSQNGNHYFEAVRILREQYGNEIHIGMGLSNVSFGMPNRRLINQTFIHLALEAGIDSGIIDPIQTKMRSALGLDTESEPFKLASDMLLGRDEFCIKYIQAFREGRLG